MSKIKNYVVYGVEDYTLPSFFINVESIEKAIQSLMNILNHMFT